MSSIFIYLCVLLVSVSVSVCPSPCIHVFDLQRVNLTHCNVHSGNESPMFPIVMVDTLIFTIS